LKNIITKKEIQEAKVILQKYKDGKSSLENRIVEDEMFWKRRHWEVLRKKDDKTKPSSGWMFNAIANKHADAMDSYPEAVCLPREKSDEESANKLTQILPVTLERNNFQDTYSDNWWYKLKHGTCAYGVFWNNNLENGLGDVQVTKIDLLNIFWEPGVRDIEKSRNLFICDLVPVDVLKEQYKDAEIKGGKETEIKKYIYDNDVDTTDKALVVDWYYKKAGKLHYCKFCEDNVLYSSENEGFESWYDDGEYPVVFDVLYPEEGTAVGFGIISVTKDAQLYIDLLDEKVMNYIHAAANPRFFAKESSGIKEDEFLDVSKPIVHVEGDLDEKKVKQIVVQPLNGYVMNFREAKIEELKETSSNRDFSQGGTANGVTSGAAIAVLQEAGNKTSRDMIDASYRTFTKIIHKMIERMRQFYDETRTFRILGESGEQEYMQFDNSGIAEQSMGVVGEQELFRKPIFDIDVKAQRQSPFSTLSQNETAMNLYNAGFFNPEAAQPALAALKLMSFEGKKEVEDYVVQGQTLYNQLLQTQQQLQMLMQENAMLKGIPVNEEFGIRSAE
jgi:hypothetical protein